MAGIAGIIRRDGAPVDREPVQRMCAALRHRGPDGERYRAFSSHRATGEASDAPPMVLLASRYFLTEAGATGQLPANRAGTIGISFDGHLDNYHELRRDLERAGCSFHSREAPEVILHLYEQGADNWLERLDGAFAFALWDGPRGRLLLVRDRLGRKPLYYADSGRAVSFASEVKALLEGGTVRAALHPRALAECFTFQNNYGRETLFQGVHIVLPGTMVVAEGDGLQERRWFELHVSGSAYQGDFDNCARDLRELLEDSVKSQLEPNRNPGVYLSGGIDSGAITALAAPHAPELYTFTCGFDTTGVAAHDAGVDERGCAERVAARYQTSHYSRTIRAGDMARVLPSLIHAQEELRLGMSYQNYYAAQLASKFVGVALGGIGGDELFAGYPWRNRPAAQCRSLADFEVFCHRTYQRLVPEAEWSDLFSPAARRDIGDFSARYALLDVFCDTDPDDDFLHRALLFEMRTSLHAQLLLEDKIQMRFSMDYRTPLLSNRMLEFALSIPGPWKLGEQNGKLVYRRAVEGLLPADLVSAKKQGFCPPDRSWFRGLTLPYVREVLFSPRALERNIFQRDYVERVLDEHQRGSADRRLLIWSFLCFELWCRIWLDGDADDIAHTLP